MDSFEGKGQYSRFWIMFNFFSVTKYDKTCTPLFQIRFKDGWNWESLIYQLCVERKTPAVRSHELKRQTWSSWFVAIFSHFGFVSLLRLIWTPLELLWSNHSEQQGQWLHDKQGLWCGYHLRHGTSRRHTREWFTYKTCGLNRKVFLPSIAAPPPPPPNPVSFCSVFASEVVPRRSWGRLRVKLFPPLFVRKVPIMIVNVFRQPSFREGTTFFQGG